MRSVCVLYFCDGVQGGALALEFRDVGAGDESLAARAGEHDDAHLRVGGETGQDLLGGAPHLVGDGVVLLRVVEGMSRPAPLSTPASCLKCQSPVHVYQIRLRAAQVGDFLRAVMESARISSVCSPASGAACADSSACAEPHRLRRRRVMVPAIRHMRHTSTAPPADRRKPDRPNRSARTGRRRHSAARSSSAVGRFARSALDFRCSARRGCAKRSARSCSRDDRADAHRRSPRQKRFQIAGPGGGDVDRPSAVLNAPVGMCCG